MTLHEGRRSKPHETEIYAAKSNRDHHRQEMDYAAWGERLVAEGWEPYLLTFMFRPISGSATQVASVMEAEVVRVYATLLPRTVRNPTRLRSRGRHPIWFCAPDYPVYKRSKLSKLDAFVNDGRHMHAVAFQPPWSRMREDLSTHFESHRSLYVRREFPLDRIDVEPVSHDIGYVIGYAGKAIDSGRAGEDATLILPRSLPEMRHEHHQILPQVGRTVNPRQPDRSQLDVGLPAARMVGVSRVV